MDFGGFALLLLLLPGSGEGSVAPAHLFVTVGGHCRGLLSNRCLMAVGLFSKKDSLLGLDSFHRWYAERSCKYLTKNQSSQNLKVPHNLKE